MNRSENLRHSVVYISNTRKKHKMVPIKGVEVISILWLEVYFLMKTEVTLQKRVHLSENE